MPRIPYVPGKEPNVSDIETHKEDGIFPHECNHPDCKRIIEFDDEPYCFTHSPEEGPSHLPGYSARRAAANPGLGTRVRHNVFDEEQT